MDETPHSNAAATSLTLLERARDNDAAAWRRLIHLYSPLVFFWARRSGLNDEDAADVVQDVWTSVSTALDRFQKDANSGTFRGWLWTIARNKLRDHGRKRAGAEAAGGSEAQARMLEVPDREPDDETGVESTGLLHRALAALNLEFEDRTWRAFWETTIVGRPGGEVAVELGLTPNAVHQAKFRVLRRLRQEMAGLGLESELARA